jgi:hypothetical protein
MNRASIFACAVFLLVTVARPTTQTSTNGANAVPPIKPVAASPPTLRTPPPTAFSTVRGTAADSAGHLLPHAMVRLRDARMGRILNTQATDTAGGFSFASVDPGNYVVELIGNATTVVATSPLVSVNAGELATVAVRLPGGPSLLAALLGRPPVFGEAVGAQLVPEIVALVPQGLLLAVPAVVQVGYPVSER